MLLLLRDTQPLNVAHRPHFARLCLIGTSHVESVDQSFIYARQDALLSSEYHMQRAIRRLIFQSCCVCPETSLWIYSSSCLLSFVSLWSSSRLLYTSVYVPGTVVLDLNWGLLFCLYNASKSCTLSVGTSSY